MRLPTGLMGLALLLAGCGEESATAVFLKLEIETVDRPFFVNIEWFGPNGRINLRDSRIPAIGNLPLKGRALGSAYIEPGDNEPLGPRRALVKGSIDKDVYWGAERVTFVDGQVVEQTIVLKSIPIPDADGDTVPDAIDECANGDDRVKCP